MQKWVPILGLQDWNIVVTVSQSSAFQGGSDHFGQATSLPQYLHADIVLLDPNHWPGAAFDDAETVLVHELLHVKFSDFAETLEVHHDNAVHRTITSLSRALVRMDRGKK